MPLFFVDTSDSVNFVGDETGHSFEDVEAAKVAAVDALADMARDGLPGRDAQAFLAVIRDDAGRTVLHASLTLKIEAFVPPH